MSVPAAIEEYTGVGSGEDGDDEGGQNDGDEEDHRGHTELPIGSQRGPARVVAEHDLLSSVVIHGNTTSRR